MCDIEQFIGATSRYHSRPLNIPQPIVGSGTPCAIECAIEEAESENKVWELVAPGVADEGVSTRLRKDKRCKT